MRLNLGEIAVILGCRPDMVVWNGPSVRRKMRGKSAPEAPSLQEAGKEQAFDGGRLCLATEDGLNHIWESAPWAAATPTGAQVDSRKVRPGNLFFCLAGERVDGHDFAAAAAEAGASVIIAERNPFPAGSEARPATPAPPPVFLVRDVKSALWRLAMCHRDTCLARIVGITGTAGKTSVKEVLAQVLEQRGRTDKNHLNLNNQIGLPLSMLNASADASFWVMELGISEARDMDELGSILRPDVGMILNVGDGHLLGLGDEGVAAYKARLLDYIQLGGTALISGDYPDLNAEVEARRPRMEQRGISCLRFSVSDEKAACRARYVGPASGSGGLYEIFTHDKTFIAETPFRGEFGSENVAAIAAAALVLGITEPEVSAGLAQAKLPEQRFSFKRYGDFCLLDDSYNANPLSSRRMISAAERMAREYGIPLVLVMGEMLELGGKAASAHEELGGHMARAKPLGIFWKGGNGDNVLKGLKDAGYAGMFYPVGGGQDFSLLLEELDLDGALVLFKGSRSNHLENLVDVFRERIAPTGDADAV